MNGRTARFVRRQLRKHSQILYNALVNSMNDSPLKIRLLIAWRVLFRKL